MSIPPSGSQSPAEGNHNPLPVKSKILRYGWLSVPSPTMAHFSDPSDPKDIAAGGLLKMLPSGPHPCGGGGQESVPTVRGNISSLEPRPKTSVGHGESSKTW